MKTDEARELAEAAREPAATRRGFCGGLFMGRFERDRLFPFPEQPAADRAAGDVFLN